MDKLQQYLGSIDDLFTTDIPDALNQLWHDITRYGPSMEMPNFPEVHIPGFDFEVPAPPPPIAPPTQLERVLEWTEKNPWEATGVVAVVVGAGLLAGYGGVYYRAERARRAATPERRQIVVVLGGDTPFGIPLVLDLEKKGYIVITSVATPEAVELLEHKSQGYLRALVLDPSQPDTVPVFLRSLGSTMSRKFPLTSAGDPFGNPSSHPYIHSVVSLLTLWAPGIHAPLEHISLEKAYIPHLNVTQITPLHIIQALLPMMRTGPFGGKKSVIFCLPATEARIGLPFSSVQAMSAAGTLRAAEVLRREVQVAALTGKSEFMKNIKVVVVDVGSFQTGGPSKLLPPKDIYRNMEKWTTSEKLTYGPGFAALAYRATSTAKSDWHAFWSIFADSHQYGIPRKQTDMRVFVKRIVGVVSNGQHGGPSILGYSLGLGRIQNWLRGERFSVGAGAKTYRLASFLPSLLLEILLNIPHFLISVRNSLLPAQPYIRPPTDPLPSNTVVSRISNKPHVESDPEDVNSHHDRSDTGSEADVESNEGDVVGPDSWVSLRKEPVSGLLMESEPNLSL
ncbi:hypothetical protein C8J56DRAFT_925475 [Mycena floridula]|nr:hypothetical protein C8J56DRAFT_925475 [Mycena floridula]